MSKSKDHRSRIGVMCRSNYLQEINRTMITADVSRPEIGVHENVTDLGPHWPWVMQSGKGDCTLVATRFMGDSLMARMGKRNEL